MEEGSCPLFVVLRKRRTSVIDCFCACYPFQNLLHFGDRDVFDESWILPACQSVWGRDDHGGGFPGRETMG